MSGGHRAVLDYHKRSRDHDRRSTQAGGGCYAALADAICINQEVMIEKRKQVQMMAKIYSQARIVVSWVGAEADGSDASLRELESLGKIALTQLLRMGLDDDRDLQNHMDKC